VPSLVVLHGDETGEELLAEALRVLDPAITGFPLDLQHVDLSLEHRRRTANGVVAEAARLLLHAGVGLKAATVTPAGADDVGSPNALLREAIGATVILRVGRLLPGVTPYPGVRGPVAVVRMAVGEAYGAEERRQGEADSPDEVAFRTERLERRVCRAVAETAFDLAERMGARVFGGPKFTVSRLFEGMLLEELDRAAARHRAVDYEPQLIDTTYALLMRRMGEPLVIPCLNRDGDCLSDLVLPLFGSIAGAESTIVATGPDGRRTVTLAEAPHGTAPTLQGLHQANPLAMILAAAGAVEALPGGAGTGRRIRQAALAALADGVATVDLGGSATTEAFTDCVIRHLGRAG
jgi:isocitrate dehydrogenase (NAD+)